MPIEWADGHKPLGDDHDFWRLLRGRDVDITEAHSALTTLEDADIFLVDEAAAGNLTSTKKIASSDMKTYFQSGLTSNVTTNLTIGGTTTTKTIISSDGTDAVIPVATTSVSGVMSKAIFDEHTANNAKNTDVNHNATHTGDVTGATALTIASDVVHHGMLNDDIISGQALLNLAPAIDDHILISDTSDSGIVKKMTSAIFKGDLLPKTGGAMTGAITTNSTFDGVDIATRDAILTSTTLTANASLPKAGGTMTGDLNITATDKLTFDGGGDTYIHESSADVLRVEVGGDVIMQITESGDDGNNVLLASSIGFEQKEPIYHAISTNVDFRFSNKQFLTFGAGNIANIQMYFPLSSGNFTLLLKQDGTGSRTVTNWKAYEFDESSADGSSATKWAGGTQPTLTTDANHVDILSFYWDADNEIAYGVATLDFQF
tara:strand:- start:5003 stop:6298 length:1296 start_codon:yes stop_codon:yes gene_type:complete